MPPNKVDKNQTEAKHKRLNHLIVEKQIKQTTKYDTEIQALQKFFDYFNFGIQ